MTGTVPTPDDSALIPGLSLSVGVTGHRPDRLDGIDLDALASGVGAVLDEIGRATTLLGTVGLRLVSGIAEGADSIVADAALVRGWTLDVVLPFARSDYATDFPSGDGRDRYNAHLAVSGAVFELPGVRTDESAGGIAYERAGRVVLAQCDVLIAVWDNGPGRGRGGSAQIVAEAVLQGIPVIHLDPARPAATTILWDGLIEHDLGQQTVETVARGDLDRLPDVLRPLVESPVAPDEAAMLARFGRERAPSRGLFSLAYPLLLAVTGVRGLRRRDFGRVEPDPLPQCGAAPAFDARLAAQLEPRFIRADTTASAFAQLFRSSYVTNFSFAALAVVLSLLGLALPAVLKPVLIVGEVVTIGVILMLTRTGNRAGWHRRWLDNRHLAERLRCLTLSAQLGDLDLRADAARRPGWVGWYARASARELGLPDVAIDKAYLDCVRRGLVALIEGQTAYLHAEAGRMHRLDHRLHVLGTVLFAATAIVCLGVLMLKVADEMSVSALLAEIAHPALIAATIASAAFPAIGAAIYGIRMQGDFAGTAERNEALAQQLAALGHIVAEDATDFDTLWRRVRRTTDLLTEDLANWLQTYTARPLALPG